MTKEQYLDLLRYYFRQAKTEDLNEIISDYEEHFIAGHDQQLSDEEIIENLGDPKDIYNEYLSEGIVTEKKGLLKGDLKEIMDRAQREITAMKPKMPYLLTQTSKAVLYLSTIVAYLIAIICWFITPFTIYLLSIQWQPFTNIPPLPQLSLTTLIALALTGVGCGFTSFFIGGECYKYYKFKD